MKRRDFLTRTNLATVGLTTLFMEGCNNTNKYIEGDTLNSYDRSPFELMLMNKLQNIE